MLRQEDKRSSRGWGGVERSRMYEQHIIYGVRSVSSIGAGDSITVQGEKGPGRNGSTLAE